MTDIESRRLVLQCRYDARIIAALCAEAHRYLQAALLALATR